MICLELMSCMSEDMSWLVCLGGVCDTYVVSIYVGDMCSVGELYVVSG